MGPADFRRKKPNARPAILPFGPYALQKEEKERI
jgi:hypothetical protein